MPNPEAEPSIQPPDPLEHEIDLANRQIAYDEALRGILVAQWLMNPTTVDAILRQAKSRSNEILKEMQTQKLNPVFQNDPKK